MNYKRWITAPLSTEIPLYRGLNNYATAPIFLIISPWGRLVFYYYAVQVPAEIDGIFSFYTVDEDDNVMTDWSQ